MNYLIFPGIKFTATKQEDLKSGKEVKCCSIQTNFNLKIN